MGCVAVPVTEHLVTYYRCPWEPREPSQECSDSRCSPSEWPALLLWISPLLPRPSGADPPVRDAASSLDEVIGIHWVLFQLNCVARETRWMLKPFLSSDLSFAHLDLRTLVISRHSRLSVWFSVCGYFNSPFPLGEVTQRKFSFISTGPQHCCSMLQFCTSNNPIFIQCPWATAWQVQGRPRTSFSMNLRRRSRWREAVVSLPVDSFFTCRIVYMKSWCGYHVEVWTIQRIQDTWNKPTEPILDRKYF